MPAVEVRGSMWERDGAWHAVLERAGAGALEVSAISRAECLARLREAAGPGAMLTVEVEPEVVGVAEAARILGWDKRRVSTYVRRGSFPEPVAVLASGRIWRRADVEGFAAAARARRSARQGSPATR
ncbi:MAG: hypothetical protein HY658_00225 [Actinobacteria bacterium]|nr:hypothetical protein [Actinomycetota bacterium]